MNKQTLRIATRKSQLALWQAQHVKTLIENKFQDLQCDLVPMSTQGDKLLHTSLMKVGGKGLFVKELENALLEKKADIAVHSMKDVPIQSQAGLDLVSILERADPRDAFVSNDYAKLSDLPHKATVGTSSLRRQTQLKALRPDLRVLNCRGNVNTRLAKLDQGEYDAIILATAGLQRLQLESRIASAIPIAQMLPAAGQGALGIECRADDMDLVDRLKQISCHITQTCVSTERIVNIELGASCQVPVAAYCTHQQGELVLRALVGSPEGEIQLHQCQKESIENAESLGHKVAEGLFQQGARSILDALNDD